jgi:hypothetical protein
MPGSTKASTPKITAAIPRTTIHPQLRPKSLHIVLLNSSMAYLLRFAQWLEQWAADPSLRCA